MCGNFGLLLLDARQTALVLELLRKMLEVAMVRGAQSAGLVTYSAVRVGGVYRDSFGCRSRVVNGKRTNLATLLLDKFLRQLERRRIHGTFGAIEAPQLFQGHTRFATSSLTTRYTLERESFCILMFSPRTIRDSLRARYELADDEVHQRVFQSVFIVEHLIISHVSHTFVFVCATLVLVLACIYATPDPPTPMPLCNATTPLFSICHTRLWPHLSFLCVVSSFILRRIFLYFGGVYSVTPYSHTVDLASPGADAIRTAGHPEGGELTGNGASRAALVRLLEAEGTHVAADTSSRTSLTMAISTFSNSDRRERRSAWTISWRQKKKKKKTPTSWRQSKCVYIITYILTSTPSKKISLILSLP